jgi:hypothetical protein
LINNVKSGHVYFIALQKQVFKRCIRQGGDTLKIAELPAMTQEQKHLTMCIYLNKN